MRSWNSTRTASRSWSTFWRSGSVSAAADEIQLAVEPRWGGYYTSGAWLPLTLTIENHGDALRTRVFIESGDAYYEGRLPTNLSGGLLGTMHAVGATGIFQIVEVMWQLQNRWARFHEDPAMWERFGKTRPDSFRNLQVENAERGAAVSHAGTGSHVTVAILESEDGQR